MGITGLIPFVSEAMEKVEVNKLSGKRVAIDSYCWLHKGAFGCAEKLAIGEKTTQYVKYCTNMLDMLLYNGIRPVMVFDGRHLPAKANEEKNRRDERKKKKQLAAQFLRSGQRDKARRYIASSIDVTHEMALELIRTCRDMKIDSIVAPYEADAQLAYLNLNGFVDCVITEDSDLMLFGCKKVLFKLQKTGEAQLYDQAKLHKVMDLNEDTFDFALFRRMCILSGCDYLPSLPGIGLAKAKKVMLRARDLELKEAFKNMGKYLNMPKLEVSEEYIRDFFRAEATFQYQYVYDPYKRKCVRLNKPTEDCSEELLAHSGAFIEDQEAFQHALGNIDPFSRTKMDDWNPDNVKLWPKSIWHSCVEIFKKDEHELTDVKPAFEVTTHPQRTGQIRTSTVLEDDDEKSEDIVNEYKIIQNSKKPKLEPIPSISTESSRNIFSIKKNKNNISLSKARSPEKVNKIDDHQISIESQSENSSLEKIETEQSLDNKQSLSPSTNKTPPSSPLKSVQASPILNTQPKRKLPNSKFLRKKTDQLSIDKKDSISSFFKQKSIPIIYAKIENRCEESPPLSQKSECENEYIDDNIIVIEETASVKSSIKKTSPAKNVTVKTRLSRNQVNKNDTSQKLLTSFGFMRRPQLGL